MNQSITWKTIEYGRESDLHRLNKARNNRRLRPIIRAQADRSHGVILEQLRDKKYLSLRGQLIDATIAGDLQAVRKIELTIRDYMQEPKDIATGDDD